MNRHPLGVDATLPVMPAWRPAEYTFKDPAYRTGCVELLGEGRASCPTIIRLNEGWTLVEGACDVVQRLS
jgi:hypothetical protein